jgi:hypothetical protein
MGYLYLAHLEGKLGDPSTPRNSAGHYLGSALDWEAREQEHRDGAGARLLAAANARGIAWRIVQVWELPTLDDAQIAEHVLKARGHFRTRCLHCRAAAAGEQPPIEPIVTAATLDDFAGYRPIAAVVERRMRYLVKRAAEREAERHYLAAVHADRDATTYSSDSIVCGPNGDTLGTVYGDPSTSYPLELVDNTFDLDVWRRGELDAAAHEVGRVRHALRGE